MRRPSRPFLPPRPSVLGPVPVLGLALALAACGETVPVEEAGNRAGAGGHAEPAAMVAEAVPVRIGEAGASFAACNAAGTTRNLRAGETLPVKAAPFDSAASTGAIPAGARFFICSRSHDQKWFGVVFDESGTLAPACGVSAPVTRRQPYDGPCEAGWVASAFVKLISGVDSGSAEAAAEAAPAATPAEAPAEAPAGA